MTREHQVAQAEDAVGACKAKASLEVSREACSRALEEAREADHRREAAEKRAWELQACSASLDRQVDAQSRPCVDEGGTRRGGRDPEA